MERISLPEKAFLNPYHRDYGTTALYPCRRKDYSLLNDKDMASTMVMNIWRLNRKEPRLCFLDLKYKERKLFNKEVQLVHHNYPLILDGNCDLSLQLFIYFKFYNVDMFGYGDWYAKNCRTDNARETAREPW